jgi:seryl-tRNA synthetase
MFDIKWIRDNADIFDAGLKKRGLEALSARLIALDDRRREHIAQLQDAQTRRNAASKEIGRAIAAGNNVLAEKLKAEVAGLKVLIHDGEQAERQMSSELTHALETIPNLPLGDVPVGFDEAANVIHKTCGDKPQFSFKPKEHFEIGEVLGQMDFERAARLSGARFAVLNRDLARLERALGQFMLDIHTNEHGYVEISPPLLVNDKTMYGTGQLPKFADDLFVARHESLADIGEYKIELSLDGAIEVSFVGANAEQIENSFSGKVYLSPEGDETLESRIRPVIGSNRWLIPTAEVPLTNMVAGEILDIRELPMRMTALTPCFRSEAGSAGRDTRGMLRQHQFWKVELVSITDQDSSLEELERMLACAETVLQRLDLHYRVMLLCSGDMGFGARKTYDIEVWLPGQGNYREISSCSICGEFQARRMNARYRIPGEKSLAHVHSLNGSGVAVGRALIAVLENYQNADGSVTIPEALVAYMGGKTRIEPES